MREERLLRLRKDLEELLESLEQLEAAIRVVRARINRILSEL